MERQAGADAARIEAQLEIGPGSEIFKLFPFPHRVKLGAILSGTSLAIVTTVLATGDVAVPVAFGYHPYFHLPNVPRAEWTVTLPVRRRAHLDARNLPTGKSEAVTIPPGPLGTRTFDDLFSEIGNQPVFKLSGGGRTISVAFGPGYPVAVVYAPANDDVVCFEPMTAPTNPFEGGTPLRWVQAGASFTAMFEISVSQVTSTSA